jgi:hypothetical protein
VLRICTSAYTYGRLPVRCHGAHRDSSLNPFVLEHRIAHFWAILSPCNLCGGISVFIESGKNQNSLNGLCAMGSIFIESQNCPFFGNSMKRSQPISDSFGANIDRFPKETIELPIFGRFNEQNVDKS